MRSDTQKRINIYKTKLPRIKEKIGASGLALLIAGIVAVSATFAWVTLSRAPEVSGLATSMSANGSLEIALSKEDGSQPDEFDVDESVGVNDDVYVTNLTWGNLVNLSDARYGIDNLALRPAQLNSSALLTNPLWGAEYSSDGRIVQLNSNFAYARYDGVGSFLTSNNTYGVRAIASYVATVSDATQQEQREKIQDIFNAHTAVNQTYSQVADKFPALGTMISKYAQDIINEKLSGANAAPTNLAPYLGNVISCYEAVQDAMEAQKGAYVALANFQLYMQAQNAGTAYTPTSWDTIYANRTAYNAADAAANSSNGIIKLAGLTRFITDYSNLVADIGYLNQYYDDYRNNATPYYWSSGATGTPQISTIIAHLIDHNTMTIDLDDDGHEVYVTQLSTDNIGSLLKANGKSRKVYTYNGILIRFEQLAVDEANRLNGRAACQIKVTALGMNITVNGKAYTKASGPATFTTAYNNAVTWKLADNDSVAEDTYGMAVDFWVRTNAEETCLTLEGATAMDEQGNIVSYDGVNRVWGRSEEAQTLPIGSTTQGGGSCYVYYADTPEDMARSLDLLDAMKVAFVDESGTLLATAEMDTANVFASNGRITVPLVLTTDTRTTYTYTNEQNEQQIGRAITTLYTDVPIRIEAIIYLDGTMLGNDNVLSAATIQGQLNIQYGSSVALKTIGNSDLMDDVRLVSAYLTKSELDYDNAVTDDDLTTGVVVHVDGVDPTSMTAFFVRAINSQQGSREATFALTKQQNGDWTADYKFAAPGDYYLRYIRLGGVDYPLLEPQKITVKGLAVNSVTWGESSDSVIVRTSADSYTESVSVEFATNDRSKMPSTVSAQFVRRDGNIVSVPLSYTPSGKWTGKGTLVASNEYTLRYLIYGVGGKNFRLDLQPQGLTKTIDLSLGLRVEVLNGSGAEREEYTAGSSYEKDLMVHIQDNAGNEIEGLSDAILYYSNGGSATNTINTNLTWDEAEGCYRGVLPITRPGRYVFSSVTVAGDILTRCTASPVYRIISPDPPTYRTTSLATFNGSNIQFAPLTNDAYIDGLVIDYAESAVVDAVVYNASAVVEGKQSGYYMLRMENGDVYNAGETWVIRLPSYTTDLDAEGSPNPNAVYTQEGTWQLVMLTVYDCYDTNASLRDESNPIIWADKSSAWSTNLSAEGITPDARYDFSRLSTTVSCTYHVEMLPGATALGSVSAPFMSHYAVSDIGMKVRLTDDSGRVIPANKVGDTTLTVNYVPDTANGTYGYKVQSGAARAYTISLNAQDPDTGYRTVSAVNGSPDGDWQYVGEYNVQNLSVRLGNNTFRYGVGENGVPAQYTITTAGPSADNVTLLDENITQRYTTLGKVGDSVTGTFLQAHDPGVSAKISLITEDNSNTQYVIVDDVTMRFVMTYQDGKIAPNGGYSWGGTSPYENITINMTNNSGTYQTSKVSLLSGRYTTKLIVTVGTAESEKELKDVNAYSMTPTVKISAVDPDEQSEIKINPNLDEYIWANVEEGLISVQNHKSDFSANVYAKAENCVAKDSEGNEISGQNLISYTLPKVSLTVYNLGTNFATATATIGNKAEPSKTNTFVFRPNDERAQSDVGIIDKDSFETATGEEGCSAGTQTVTYEIYRPAGEQSFNVLTVVNGSMTYTVELTDTVTIREINSAPPSITFAESPEGYSTPVGSASEDGGSFSFTLPASIGQTGAMISEPIEGAEWKTSSDKTITEKICYYTAPNEPTLYDSGTRGSCSSKYSYWIYKMEYTYYKFTKTTETWTITTGTRNYSIKMGVVKWNVGGVEYDPGETITVNGVWTATPVIGEIAGTRTFINSSEQNGMKTRTVIVPDGQESKTVTADSDNYSKNETKTKAACLGQEDAKKPTGYEWGDQSNKKAVINTKDEWSDPVWSVSN